jgi:phenylpropionate dioxygenase-like ring-hydroxylating dioxygenase large terminal subunit
MQPTGWFQVAWSSDLGAGDVKPLRYFGTELVIFRDLDGAVHVLDAHCQHLGANLAYGGCVVDGGIQCPFHGWVWSGEGRNVRIPYEPRPNRGRRVRSWPAVEVNECVFIWHDARGREPLWQLPEWHEVLSTAVTSQDFRPLGADEQQLFRGVHVHPQIIAENAVDPHHFRFVHRTPISPVVLTERTDETTWHAKVGFGKRWSDGVDRPGDARNTIELYWSGIGYSITGECTQDGVRMIAINATPIDETTCDIFASYWVSGDRNYTERLEQAKRALPDDVNIWQHQRYMDRPALGQSEATGFAQLRRWAQGFYPETAPVSS